MFIRTLNTQLKRTRGLVQILMTLFSFFGFNEAVLVARYRSSLYLCNVGIPMTPINSHCAIKDYAVSANVSDLTKNRKQEENKGGWHHL